MVAKAKTYNCGTYSIHGDNTAISTTRHPNHNTVNKSPLMALIDLEQPNNDHTPTPLRGRPVNIAYLLSPKGIANTITHRTGTNPTDPPFPHERHPN
jgi:hypothetical protein